jgi:hypothetical protein
MRSGARRAPRTRASARARAPRAPVSTGARQARRQPRREAHRLRGREPGPARRRAAHGGLRVRASATGWAAIEIAAGSPRRLPRVVASPRDRAGSPEGAGLGIRIALAEAMGDRKSGFVGGSPEGRIRAVSSAWKRLKVGQAVGRGPHRAPGRVVGHGVPSARVRIQQADLRGRRRKERFETPSASRSAGRTAARRDNERERPKPVRASVRAPARSSDRRRAPDRCGSPLAGLPPTDCTPGTPTRLAPGAPRPPRCPHGSPARPGQCRTKS